MSSDDETQPPPEAPAPDEDPAAIADDGMAPLIDNTGADDSPEDDADAPTG